jgi:hypothetical protein
VTFWLLLKRFGSWLVANPLVATILALLAALAGETGRRRYAQRQAAKAEAKAIVARVEGAVAVERAGQASSEAGLAQAQALAEKAEAEGQAAMGKVAAPPRRSFIAWGPGGGVDRAVSGADKIDARLGVYLIWVLGP